MSASFGTSLTRDSTRSIAGSSSITKDEETGLKSLHAVFGEGEEFDVYIEERMVEVKVPAKSRESEVLTHVHHVYVVEKIGAVPVVHSTHATVESANKSVEGAAESLTGTGLKKTIVKGVDGLPDSMMVEESKNGLRWNAVVVERKPLLGLEEVGEGGGGGK